MASSVHSALTEENAVGILKEAQEAVNLYLKPGLGPQGSTKAYDDTSAQYDQYVGAFEYGGPVQAAKSLAELYPEQQQRERVRILDVAAGTGLVGIELQKLGFKLMDALDPSQGMLNEAAKRGVYQKFFCEYIGDSKLPIEDNTYDGMVICGGMGENQIPTSALNEMVRIVKPGGYIVNVTRVEHIDNVSEYRGRLLDLMAKLEKEGKWKQVSRTTFPNFLRGKEGLYFVHQILS